MTSTRTWFRTRWAALHWLFRTLIVPLAAIFTTALLMALVLADWGWALSAYGSLFACWLFVDWNYWRKFGEVSKPVAEFGARMSGAIHAATADGQRALTLDIDGDQCTLRRRQDDATESSDQ